MKGFNTTNSRQRGKGMMTSMFKRLFWGLGAAVLTYVVAPKMRRMAKPAMEKGMEGVKDLAERGKQTIEKYKSPKEDSALEMVSEAAQEQAEVATDMIYDKLDALQGTIENLKKEINQLRQRN